MQRTMLITGGTHNTGYAIARRFAQEGYRVGLTSRSKERAEEAAQRLSKETGAFCCGYQLSMTDPTEIEDVFTRADAELKGVSAFVGNSANLGVDIDLLTATPQQYDEVMDVNIKGNYFCCQQAARIMRRDGGGSIVLMGSVHYREAIWGRSLYAASKGALASLVRSMAYELGIYGIRANCVIAGAIRTERWDTMTPEQVAARRKNWPIGVESTGEDIANAVYFLGSEQSKTITGTDLTVDSGVTICLLPFEGGKQIKGGK